MLRSGTANQWVVPPAPLPFNAAGEVYRLERDTSSTNQRIQFDIEPCGRHLATGGCGGCVKVRWRCRGVGAAAGAVPGEMQMHGGLAAGAIAAGLFPNHSQKRSFSPRFPPCHVYVFDLQRGDAVDGTHFSPDKFYDCSFPLLSLLPFNAMCRCLTSKRAMRWTIPASP